MGFVERLFFTPAVALAFPDVLTAMMGWPALKVAANWGKRPPEDPHRFSGGLICQLGVPDPTWTIYPPPAP